MCEATESSKVSSILCLNLRSIVGNCIVLESEL
jgi:hypothetical protein